ncbi:hypothetical protein HPB51_018495 [Rhipicephalus microplus]|uniref:SAP domain-containing protein n=1 Tax=Rhipicephalus microplus TaxID=6941 RepID=A0A9J6EJ02_RHIMP|nr:hypothetical protein HPB51_018495 [Rhipicephalus microplus]
MAQSTGCESTELHAEEEMTPREGATPRCSSSRDSETTIVESVFTTLDHSTMANATKKQLVDELRARGLRCSGRKDELITRIIRDITRQALEPTDSSTKDQAAYDDDRQVHLETLSADNARLCAELSSLRVQLNRATTSERETLQKAHQNASLPTERVTTSSLGLHHSVPSDITMSSGLTRPPSLNDGTNQDTARPAAPTVSTHEGEPSMAQILAALVNTQALLANTLSRGPPTTSLIQIHSTSDTSSSIFLFDGTPQQKAHEWITQVERIAALAHWTPSLTLVTAASRLTGSAKDWHSAYGSQYDTWEQWKEALILQFKRKLTMQEFLELQTKRRLQSHETIVEYMYSKNAILNKAPYRLAEEEHISLIISGIEDDTWANPLAAQLCGTVTELIDRAALLDARRRTTVCAENDKKPSSSTASRAALVSRGMGFQGTLVLVQSQTGGISVSGRTLAAAGSCSTWQCGLRRHSCIRRVEVVRRTTAESAPLFKVAYPSAVKQLAEREVPTSVERGRYEGVGHTAGQARMSLGEARKFQLRLSLLHIPMVAEEQTTPGSRMNSSGKVGRWAYVDAGNRCDIFDSLPNFGAIRRVFSFQKVRQ